MLFSIAAKFILILLLEKEAEYFPELVGEDMLLAWCNMLESDTSMMEGKQEEEEEEGEMRDLCTSDESDIDEEEDEENEEAYVCSSSPVTLFCCPKNMHEETKTFSGLPRQSFSNCLACFCDYVYDLAVQWFCKKTGGGLKKELPKRGTLLRRMLQYFSSLSHDELQCLGCTSWPEMLRKYLIPPSNGDPTSADSWSFPYMTTNTSGWCINCLRAQAHASLKENARFSEKRTLTIDLSPAFSSLACARLFDLILFSKTMSCNGGAASDGSSYLEDKPFSFFVKGIEEALPAGWDGERFDAPQFLFKKIFEQEQEVMLTVIVCETNSHAEFFGGFFKLPVCYVLQGQG